MSFELKVFLLRILIDSDMQGRFVMRTNALILFVCSIVLVGCGAMLTKEKASNYSVEDLCVIKTKSLPGAWSKEAHANVKSELERRGVLSCDPVAIDAYYCNNYGFQKQSEQYGFCMLAMAQIRTQRYVNDTARQQAASAALMQIGLGQMSQPQPKQVTPVTTTCTSQGNNVSCVSQ